MPTPEALTRYLVATLKGGPGKTTSAFYIALAMARRGHRVTAIDADPGSQGLWDWYSRILLRGQPAPFTVVQWTAADSLVAYAEQIERDTNADRVIIDAGGESPDRFKEGCKFAQQLICPVGPMQGELGRVPATMDAAAEIKGKRIDAAALLTRVSVAGKGAAADARRYLAGLDVYTLRTEIVDRRTEYANAWGKVPRTLGEYGELMDEFEPAEAA